MTLLEGHATFVMNEVAEGRVHDLDRMRNALRERRARAVASRRCSSRRSGSRRRLKQYAAGERFVRDVVERGGDGRLQPRLAREANLPDPRGDRGSGSLGGEGRERLMRRPPAVARVLERVTRTAREHEMFGPGDRVFVCVSGGPDSVCLLYPCGTSVRCSGSGSRSSTSTIGSAPTRRRTPRTSPARRAARACRSTSGRPTTRRQGGLRRGVGDLARRNAANDVRRASGHRRRRRPHARRPGRDRADEPDPRRRARSGRRHLARRGEARRSALAQPLIEVDRAEVEAFCRALHLRPRVDPTNRDTRYLRNAIRLSVLPAIERATGREVKRPIARSADLLREDRWELDASAVHAVRAAS